MLDSWEDIQELEKYYNKYIKTLYIAIIILATSLLITLGLFIYAN